MIIKNKISLLIALASFLFITLYPASAREPASERVNGRPTGVGIILGEPIGFTGKVWLGSHQAADLGLAFSFDSYFLIYSDYLFHFPGAFGKNTEFIRGLEPYVGVGGEILIADNSRNSRMHYYDNSRNTLGVAIRVPFGLEWVGTDVPIGIFAEIVPGVGIVPGTYGFFQGGIGARYYF